MKKVVAAKKKKKAKAIAAKKKKKKKKKTKAHTRRNKREREKYTSRVVKKRNAKRRKIMSKCGFPSHCEWERVHPPPKNMRSDIANAVGQLMIHNMGKGGPRDNLTFAPDAWTSYLNDLRKIQFTVSDVRINEFFNYCCEVRDPAKHIGLPVSEAGTSLLAAETSLK